MQKQLLIFLQIAIIVTVLAKRVKQENKKMKKTSKIAIICLTILTILGACFMLVACGDSEAEAAKKINMVNIELSSERYAFAFNKSNNALKASVNQILADKATEIDAIMNKYLNATQDQLSTFGMDIKTEQSGSNDELVVATNADFAPFEYFVGSKLAGIDIEIAKLIADELGKTLVVEHMAFEAVVTTVATNDSYDIAMAALTISADRAEVVNFSNPYFDTTQVLVVNAAKTTPFDYCTTKDELVAALSSLKNAKIGGQSGTTGQQYINGNADLEFDGYSNLEFSGYDAPALAVQDMLNGNIDYVIVDKAIAITLLKNYNK